MNGPSYDVSPHRRQEQASPSPEYVATRALPPENPVAVEANRLLDDVRTALGGDWIAASRAAACLASLLASNLPKDCRLTPARGGLAPWQVREVRNHIEDRLEEPIRVRDLAKRVSLSTSHFSRAFKGSFGEIPHAYVMSRRIERAKTLMLTTSSGLSQIAFACGLVDQAHLCRCFRRATGTTPAAWRRGQATGPQS